MEQAEIEISTCRQERKRERNPETIEMRGMGGSPDYVTSLVFN